jgi:hypothetical protein
MSSSPVPTRSTPRRQHASRIQALNSRTRHHPRPYQRSVSSAPRHVSVSATSHLSSRRDPSQPPVPPYVVLALEDTFRISARGNVTTSSSTAPLPYRDLRSSSSLRSNLSQEPNHNGSELAEDVFDAFSMAANGIDDDESGDLVVIPPLGDPEVEDDVRMLLGRHGLQGRSLEMRNDNVEDDADRMDVDDLEMDVDDVDSTQVRSGPEPELEWDCISSRAPSRTSSPPPAASSGNRWRMWPAVEPIIQDELESEDEDLGNDTGKSANTTHNTSAEDLDIAGTCFDPSGAYIYVGTTESVVEWNVRGAEKGWWLDDMNEWC